jgi:hypothetical protein
MRVRRSKGHWGGRGLLIPATSSTSPDVGLNLGEVAMYVGLPFFGEEACRGPTQGKAFAVSVFLALKGENQGRHLIRSAQARLYRVIRNGETPTA